MLFHQIMKEFSFEYPVYQMINAPMAEILYVSSELPSADFSDYTLYSVTDTQLLAHLNETDASGSYLCLLTSLETSDFIAFSHANLLFVEKEEHQKAFLSVLKSILKQEAVISAFVRNILNSVLSFDELIAKVTDILNNPFIICDMGHNIIAQSDVPYDGYAWKRFKELKYEPFQADNVKEFHQFLDNCAEGKYVELSDNGIDGTQTIRAALISGQDVFGYITIFSLMHPFTQADITTIHLIANLIAAELLRKAYLPSYKFATDDYLLYDLITGRLNNLNIIEEKLKFSNWHPRKFFYLFVAEWNDNEDNIDILDHRAAEFDHLFDDGCRIIVDSKMIRLFSLDEEIYSTTSASHPLPKQLEEFLSDALARGALSQPFTSLAETKQHYEGLKTALTHYVKNGSRITFFHEDAAMLELILAAAQEKYDLRNLCHPLVLKLLDYDYKNKTDYTKYLAAYVCSGRNYSKAASRLYTHRNTVIYRLNKIEELLGYNFQEEGSVFPFELSYHILEFIYELNHFPEEDVLKHYNPDSYLPRFDSEKE